MSPADIPYWLEMVIAYKSTETMAVPPINARIPMSKVRTLKMPTKIRINAARKTVKCAI